MSPTSDEIEAAKTEAGGWTRATLERWGVPWPPPKGWRRELEQLAQEPPEWADVDPADIPF